MIKLLPLVLIAALTASCGSNPDTPEGSGIEKVEASKAPTEFEGVKIERDVIDQRLIRGTWNGQIEEGRVEFFIGAKNAASIQLIGPNGILESASGTYRMNDDRTLSGEFSDLTGVLSPYSNWNAAFEGSNRMNIAGTDGTITVTSARGTSQPVSSSNSNELIRYD